MALTLDPTRLARQQADDTADYYHVGQAHGLLIKAAATPMATPVLHGRLIVPQSGWALLTVPNALVRGLFDAMDETGIELPPGHEGGPFSAHVSVMTGDEVKKLGGPDAISERGHPFNYQLGPMQSVEPHGWSEMSRVWFVKVISPELKALRKSYGLTPLPNGDHNFHISVAVRRRNVLQPNEVSKAAAADDGDEDDGEDVHGRETQDHDDVHQSDDDDSPVKVRIPLVMQRIVITRLSFGKPKDGDDDEPDNDNGIEEFMNRLRERHDQTKAGAAIDPQIMGGLVGAGLGGLGGYGIGKWRGAKRPWLDAMAGAGAGGLAGSLYGGLRPGKTVVSAPEKAPEKPAPTEPVIPEHLKPPKPAPESKESLVQNVKRFYRNAPGGIEGVIQRAEGSQFIGPGENKWKHNDPYIKYPIQQTTQKGMADIGVSGAAGVSSSKPGRTPGSDVFLLPPDATRSVREYQQNKEHELTHAALQLEPLSRATSQAWPWQRQRVVDDYSKTMKRPGTPQNMLGGGMDYLTAPSELGPRLAQVKRFYAEAHPGQDVTTPEEAQKALDWFKGYSQSDEGKYRLGTQSEFWKDMFGDPDWSKVVPEAVRRMPGLVQNAPVVPASMKVAAADYAPGLPSKSDMGRADKLRVGQMLDFIVQQHNAQRAGQHYDVRFGNKDTGLLSWAARKGLPEPGAKHLAVQQPVHRHGYKDFEGEIPEGYGKGTVKKHTEGQVLITKVTPESVHFTTAHQRHPERYVLARPKGWGNKDWLMMNTTPRDEVPYEKVHYKKISPDQVEPHLKAMQEGDTAEAKVDGASQLVQLAKGHAEMLSFRTSKTTGRPIFHTERFFGGRPDIPVPKHLEGSILKGEMYASRLGRPQERGTAGGGAAVAGRPAGGNGAAALPATAAIDGGPGGPTSGADRRLGPQDVGTLLNSSIARSLQIQKERGLTLKNMLYDVQQYGKKPIDPVVTPRSERRRMLEEIAGHLPQDKFHVSEEARDPAAATKLWDMVRSGQHPLTEEGLVFHPKTGIPSKAKLMEEHDVHITGTFPGEGKRQATIGGFTYGHEPGKTVGKVGTGFSDQFLNEVARDPAAYTGRVARLRSQQKLPSGALRVPSFIGLHEDINKTAAAKLASFFGPDSLPVVEPDIDPVTGQPRRRRPPSPPPSWLDTLRQGLFGSPNAIVPDIVQTLEEEGDGAGMIPKTGAAVDWTGGLGKWFSSEPPAAKLPDLKLPVGAPPAPPAPPAVPELPPNPFAFAARPPAPATPAYPSATGTALGQLAARPSLPPVPTGRAGPALAQVRNVLTTNRPAADKLSDALHGLNIRRDLVAASRAAGYPADPAAAPASTAKLLGQTYPHQLPAIRFENQPSGTAQYNFTTGQTQISDPLPWKGPGREPWPASFSEWLQQRAVNSVAPNRLGLARHETEHALQNAYAPPLSVRVPREATLEQRIEALQRVARDRANAMEIPPSLGDLPFAAQAHKLETGNPLNVPVTVAPGVTHDADWMARQAEQHGMFSGRTTTELLATPSGQAYLRRLLAAHTPSDQSTGVWPWLKSWFEKQNSAEKRGPEDEYCPHCDARQERGDDGRCNRCGKPWPEPRVKKAATHPALADLKRAKFESDRRNYTGKHQILSALLDKYPDEFSQDSVEKNVVGLTHKPTGFKIHAPAKVIRGRVKAATLGDLIRRWGRRAATPFRAREPYLMMESPDVGDIGHRFLTSRPTRDSMLLAKAVGNAPPRNVLAGPGVPVTQRLSGRQGTGRAALIDVAPGRMTPAQQAAFREMEARLAPGIGQRLDAPRIAAARGSLTMNAPELAHELQKLGPLPGFTPIRDDPFTRRVAMGLGGTALAAGGAGAGALLLRGGKDKPSAVPVPNFPAPEFVGPPAPSPTPGLSEPAPGLSKLPETAPSFSEPASSLSKPPELAQKIPTEAPVVPKAAPVVPKTAPSVPKTTPSVPKGTEIPWGTIGAAGLGAAGLGALGYGLYRHYNRPKKKQIKKADLLPWVDLQSQQKRVAKRVGEGQNLLVYHGLGSGKSLAGIAAAEGVGGPYTAIVPASLRPNYQGEISKFTNQETPSEVMSYTGVGMGKEPMRTPNTVIMDEVQRIRNPASAGSRAAMNLAMQAPHRVLLSGTPIVNAPSDLAAPLSILTGDEMSPAAFNKQFVGTKTVSPGFMGWLQGVKPTKVPTIQDEQGLEKLLENHVDYQPSRTPEGVKTNDERVEVDLSPEQQDFYKLMWGKLPWMMRWKLSNDYPLDKNELAHLSAFMTGPRQAALSLYPYHSSKDPMYAFKTSSKLQSAMGSLKETLTKNPKAKALVYSNFIDAGLTPYGAALKAEGIPFGQFHGTMTEEDRKQNLADYNAGKLRVLLLGPAAAEGISAKGTQLIQLLDPHWNEARMGQARGRGLRFDSHEGLPPELRDVKIQRFVAKMPPPGWLGRLFGAKPRPSADEVLEQQSRRKEELNEQFREVLRRVGSPGYHHPWSLFG